MVAVTERADDLQKHDQDTILGTSISAGSNSSDAAQLAAVLAVSDNAAEVSARRTPNSAIQSLDWTSGDHTLSDWATAWPRPCPTTP